MKKRTALLLAGGCLIAASVTLAQNQGIADALVTRMMAFDKDGDGKLTKAEVIDDRLHRLFDRADADKDGTVTKAELTALAAKDAASFRGPGGFGPPGGFGGSWRFRPTRRPHDGTATPRRDLARVSAACSRIDCRPENKDRRASERRRCPAGEDLDGFPKKDARADAPARPWRLRAARRPTWSGARRPSTTATRREAMSVR